MDTKRRKEERDVERPMRNQANEGRECSELATSEEINRDSHGFD
jgi:DNA-binding protein H-NS